MQKLGKEKYNNQQADTAKKNPNILTSKINFEQQAPERAQNLQARRGKSYLT